MSIPDRVNAFLTAHRPNRFCDDCIAESLEFGHRQEAQHATERGAAIAQEDLGHMYAKGQGVPQDFVQAHMWFNLAAARYSQGERRDNSASNRDLLAKQMTPDQVAEAQRLAREWKPK